MASEPNRVRERGSGSSEVRATHPEARRSGQVQSATYHAEGKSPQQIRSDIEHTRADMTQTIDVIQERLDPQRLRDQAREAVREATIGRAQHMAREVGHRAREAGFSLRDTVRNNPLPAAMVAVGLGWLAVQATMGGDGHAVREVEAYPEEMEGRGRELTAEARRRADETVSRVQERASETMEQAQQRAGEVAGEVQERAQQVATRAQRQVRRARGRIETMIDENPLAMGAVALAVGAAIGMALPSTRQEDRIMGKARDDLVERAEGVAEDAMHRAERVAEEAGKAAEEEAERQNLTS